MDFKKLFLLSTLSMLLCMGCGTANAEPREAAVEAWEELSDSEEDIPITWEEIPNTEEDIADAEKAIENAEENASGTEVQNSDKSSSDSDNITDASNNSVNQQEELSESSMQKLLIPPVKVKGIYVTGPAAGSERMEQLIDLVSSTELNTMVIDVKNDEGNLTYKMEVPASANLEAGIRYVKDMPALIERLHQQGIYVIARIVCFKDPVLAAARPELALRLPDGKAVMDANGLAWVNPYKEEVWDYLCTLAECASRDGFDEIQFDYVRFPIGNDANAADYGVDMSTYPREAGLTDFFDYASKRLHEKQIIFGADLFGTIIGSDVDRDRTGQNYLSIAEHTDAICPMIYPSHYANGTFGMNVPDQYPYETIANALQLSKEELSETDSPKGVVRPWLQCFNAIWVDGHITYGSKEVHDQIQAVYDAGYEEWFLWHASNHYEQVKSALTDYTYSYPKAP